MLIQIAMSQVQTPGFEYAGEGFCCYCSRSIGYLTREEVRYLVSPDNVSDMLCFDCEMIKPSGFAELSEKVKANLLRMFSAGDIHDLPLSSCDLWVNPRIGAFLELVVRRGWCLWYPYPDGEQALRRVGLLYSDAVVFRETFELRPMKKVAK